MIQIDISTERDIANLKKRIKYSTISEETVKTIVDDVKRNGDKALFEYIERFDGYKPNKNTIMVKEIEFLEAERAIPEEEKRVIQYAAGRIEKFHRKTMQSTIILEENGVMLGTRITPVKRVGLYIPGGKAAYPSTAIMTIIPAVVAGVDEIYIATPPKEGVVNPYVLYVSSLYGIKNIYKMGGAQAIASLAYGTETVPKVDVIAGPGNIYVAMAKKLVLGDVGIDSIAGPSEICIVADGKVDPRLVAADMMSQMEHDEMARAYLISTDEHFLRQVQDILKEEIPLQPRSSIIEKSSKNALFIKVHSLNMASVVVDEIAPEHLEVLTDKPFEFMNRTRNAGAIFIGQYSPEPIGDYVAGPNHTLPTSGTARFSSPLSCDTFMKKSSIIYYTRDAILRDGGYASKLASIEGLMAHKKSIDIRTNESR